MKQVIHQLDDELLKCKLAVHCYAEFPDKKLAAMVLSLLEDDLIVIKLRLPDKKQKFSRKDGYRFRNR